MSENCEAPITTGASGPASRAQGSLRNVTERHREAGHQCSDHKESRGHVREGEKGTGRLLWEVGRRGCWARRPQDQEGLGGGTWVSLYPWEDGEATWERKFVGMTMSSQQSEPPRPGQRAGWRRAGPPDLGLPEAPGTEP